MSTPRLDSDAETLSLVQDRAFWLLVAIVSIAFFWVLQPFYSAVFWAIVIAVLFAPVQRRLVAAWNGRRRLASLATLVLVLLVLILPLAWFTMLVAQEATSLYVRVQSGELQPAGWFREAFALLPPWASALLDRFGLTSFASIQDRLIDALTRGTRFLLSQGVSVGTWTFDFVIGFFVMLYVLYFLLRDGERLVNRVRLALPLQAEVKSQFAGKFSAVVRATIKGNLVIALLQGVLGGLAFWFLGVSGAVLWGAVMVVLALLPVVGPALVWLPVALYLISINEIWQGVALTAWGVIVHGLVDNVLRPILVGKDTKMPDYVVLVSTLGGIAVFGINGFVIGPVIAALFMSAWDVVAASRAPYGLDAPTGASPAAPPSPAAMADVPQTDVSVTDVPPASVPTIPAPGSPRPRPGR